MSEFEKAYNNKESVFKEPENAVKCICYDVLPNDRMCVLRFVKFINEKDSNAIQASVYADYIKTFGEQFVGLGLKLIDYYKEFISTSSI